MPAHKFKIGQSVNYQPAARNQDALRGTYQIVWHLPRDNAGEFMYRIKHSSEPHERIAKESELRSA